VDVYLSFGGDTEGFAERIAAFLTEANHRVVTDAGRVPSCGRGRRKGASQVAETVRD
jgi:hypothetical protein